MAAQQPARTSPELRARLHSVRANVGITPRPGALPKQTLPSRGSKWKNPQLDGSSTPWGVRRIRGMLRKSRLTLDVLRQYELYSLQMILNYRNKKTEQFAGGVFIKAFQGFEDQAAKRLAILNAAPALDTLRALPSNRLEALRGDRAGQYSIRINQQWRICFEWLDDQSGPSDVEIVDYH